MTTLDAGAIRVLLGPATAAGLERLSVFAEIDSTNSYLLDQPSPSPGGIRIALAEHQTGGRGRRGKAWCAPPSSSICLSVSYAFEKAPRMLPSLSLAIGVAVVEVLQGLGVNDVALKWPNDVLVGNAKLGGILAEARSVAADPPTTVVGLGLNVDLSAFNDKDIVPDRPITDLRRCIGKVPARNTIAALLIDAMYDALCAFDAQGFVAFIERWNRCDWLKGRQTTVDTLTGPLTGDAQGVDNDGALLLMTATGIRSVQSGSVLLPATAGSEG